MTRRPRCSIGWRRAAGAALTLLICVTPLARADDVPEQLRKYDQRIEQSVEKALQWIAERFDRRGGLPGQHGNTNAIPALAAMAYLSAGHTPGNGPYGAVVNQCIDYVLDSEGRRNGRPSGIFTDRSGRMYAHCICTLLLSEVSGMVDAERQERIDDALPRALNVILAAQQVQKRNPQHQGGWRYEPNSTDSDMSVTGWALMALRSARINGAAVPDDAIKDALDYIRRSFNDREGAFEYQPGQGVRYPLTAAGILSLELTGEHRGRMALKAGDYIMNPIRKGGFLQGGHTEYALYYTSQAMFQLGDDYWIPFAEVMYDRTLRSQRPDGSWNGSGYTTAMSVLALTVSYRQLPIYQR